MSCDCCCKTCADWGKAPPRYCLIAHNIADGSVAWKRSWPYLDSYGPPWLQWRQCSALLIDGALWAFGRPGSGSGFEYDGGPTAFRKIDPASGADLQAWDNVPIVINGTDYTDAWTVQGMWLGDGGEVYQSFAQENLEIGAAALRYGYRCELNELARWNLDGDPPSVKWYVTNLNGPTSPTNGQWTAYVGDTVVCTSQGTSENRYRRWENGVLVSDTTGGAGYAGISHPNFGTTSYPETITDPYYFPDGSLAGYNNQSRQVIPFDFDSGGVYGYYKVLTGVDWGGFPARYKTYIVHATGAGSLGAVATFDLAGYLVPQRYVPGASLLLCRWYAADGGSYQSLQIYGGSAYAYPFGATTPDFGQMLFTGSDIYLLSSDFSGSFGYATRSTSSGADAWKVRTLDNTSLPDTHSGPFLAGGLLILAGAETLDYDFGAPQTAPTAWTPVTLA